MKRKLLIFILSFALFLSGFLREYIMVNINWVVKHLWYGGPNYAQKEFHFLTKWSVNDIFLLKWILTIFFFSYFFALSYSLTRLLFKDKKEYGKILILVYLGMFIFSGILFLIGYLMNFSQQMYPTIRSIMGAGQSFIPFLILFLLFKFLPQKSS